MDDDSRLSLIHEEEEEEEEEEEDNDDENESQQFHETPMFHHQPPTSTSNLEEPSSINNNNDAQTSVRLVAFVNKLSGPQHGAKLLVLLRKHLETDCVFDLSEGGPIPGLLKHRDSWSNGKLRVIACGGDGTARWLLQSIIQLNIQPFPLIGVIPIGTGNDLCREFGWSASFYPDEDKLLSILTKLRTARAAPLTLWQVTRTQKDAMAQSQLQWQQRKNKVKIFFNYFNIGFDAATSLSFHELRLKSPHLFKNRFFNQCWYVFHALNAWRRGENTKLADNLTIEIDGKSVELLPNVQTVVFLNFANYQAGVDIWGPNQNDKYSPQSMQDQKIEVVGINGLIHEALLRTHLMHGYRLGQGRTVTVHINKNISLPIAFDGEPLRSGPCTFHLEPWGHVNILCNS